MIDISDWNGFRTIGFHDALVWITAGFAALAVIATAVFLVSCAHDGSARKGAVQRTSGAVLMALLFSGLVIGAGGAVIKDAIPHESFSSYMARAYGLKSLDCGDTDCWDFPTESVKQVTWMDSDGRIVQGMLLSCRTEAGLYAPDGDGGFEPLTPARRI